LGEGCRRKDQKKALNAQESHQDETVEADVLFALEFAHLRRDSFSLFRAYLFVPMHKLGCMTSSFCGSFFIKYPILLYNYLRLINFFDLGIIMKEHSPYSQASTFTHQDVAP
jgi:hypothetical protein